MSATTKFTTTTIVADLARLRAIFPKEKEGAIAVKQPSHRTERSATRRFFLSRSRSHVSKPSQQLEKDSALLDALTRPARIYRLSA